uniref:Transmembrane protein n=1 Tax=Klebsormidium flaccidum TaxID=3175 RepID=A0A0B5H4Y9_KLEFL|nr:hypothetical protein [Klebsormidium flaccidum]
MLYLKPNNYSPEMRPNREERDESHPAEKAVLCVNTKKNSKIFSYSFFCFFYRKKAVGSGLVGLSIPIFYLKKKREQARCTRLSFFIEEVEVPGCAEQKSIFQPSGVRKAFFFACERQRFKAFLSFPLTSSFLLSLPVTSIFFGRERKACY